MPNPALIVSKQTNHHLELKGITELIINNSQVILPETEEISLDLLSIKKSTISREEVYDNPERIVNDSKALERLIAGTKEEVRLTDMDLSDCNIIFHKSLEYLFLIECTLPKGFNVDQLKNLKEYYITKNWKGHN